VLNPHLFEIAQKLNSLYPPEMIRTLSRFQSVSRLFESRQPAPEPESAVAPWSRERDPNVPEDFKKLCRTLFGTQEQFLTMELTEETYSVEQCVICEYHKLAKAYYERGLGKVPQEVLWEQVSAVHKRIRNVKQGPTNRRRVLNDLGLGTLPAPSRGRKPKTSKK
jgi:hypothetical protein